jgi:hypothetical protein
MEEREIRSRATRLSFFCTAPLICAIFVVCVCKVFAVMDREWMYKTSRVEQSYLNHVTKFIAAVKRHHLSLKREHMICPCKSCKNLLAYGDDTVNLTWAGIVFSRITPSESFTRKHRIRVSMLLEEGTHRQQRWRQ